jgi:hypothetical protein
MNIKNIQNGAVAGIAGGVVFGAMMPSLVGHLVYGLILGASYSRLVRRSCAVGCVSPAAAGSA